MIKKLLLPLFLSLALLCGCSQANTTWQEQYDLGVKYLSQENYEEAILAFEAAIEIDPKRAEAYIGLAETYVAMDDPDRAAEILQQGMEAIGESDLLINAWNDLGLTPPENGGGEGDSNGEDSFASAEDLSFANMPPEEITAILPSLTQPETFRTERKDREDGRYNIEEFDAEDSLIRHVGYDPAGAEISRTEYFQDQNGHVLMVIYFSPDGNTYPGGVKYIVLAPQLVLSYSDLSAWQNAPDTSMTAYHYSGTQVTMTRQDTAVGFDCRSTVVYTMSSPENEIELWAWGSDAANNSYKYLVIREFGPDLPEDRFSAFHGDGTPYPEFDLSQFTS